MAIVEGLKFKADLCRSLGLDPDHTRKIVLVIEPDDIVTAHVVVTPSVVQLTNLCEAFRVIQADDVKVIEAQAVPFS